MSVKLTIATKTAADAGAIVYAPPSAPHAPPLLRDSEGFLIPAPLTREQLIERAARRASKGIEMKEAPASPISSEEKGSPVYSVQNGTPLSQGTLSYCERMKKTMEDFEKNREDKKAEREQLRRLNEQWRIAISADPSPNKDPSGEFTS